MVKSMWKQSRFSNRGIVSTYFLAILLYVASMASVLILTDQNSVKTVLNMKEANRYLYYETEVIQDLKCKLENHELEGQTVYLEHCDYYYEIFDAQCYVCIYGEIEEELVIALDTQTYRILKYESIVTIQRKARISYEMDI